MKRQHYDMVIIGSGAGGGTLAKALSNSGKSILLIERGDFIRRSKDNWDAGKVFGEQIYCTDETWYQDGKRPFRPKQHYCVGGSTKFYGGVLIRFRLEDFGEIRHPDGISPAWPFSYKEIEPYYSAAERLYDVHGKRGIDPTEPPSSADYPNSPIPHEPICREVFDGLAAQGLHPSPVPVAIDLRENSGNCIRCDTCDGFPCLVDGKSDSDLRCVRPVVKTGNVELLTNTQVMRLKTDPSGRRVVSAICKGSDDNEFKVVGDMFVLCAGAVNSAVILLNSRSSVHPDGLANGSGMIGRNLMFHNASALLAIDPFRSFTKHYLKTVAVNDFYLNDPRDPDYQYPLGNFQLLGNVTSGMLKAVQPLAPKMVTDYLDRHSLPFYASTEDVPVDGNRLQVSPDGRINIHYRKTNATSHNRLLRYVRQALRRLGFTFILVRAAGPDTLGHQCGTIRMGKDPASSVVDSTGKAHELENLYVADSSVFPSSSALNPGLTVMACALRTANYISDRLS